MNVFYIEVSSCTRIEDSSRLVMATDHSQPMLKSSMELDTHPNPVEGWIAWGRLHSGHPTPIKGDCRATLRGRSTWKREGSTRRPNREFGRRWHKHRESNGGIYI
jgi:hypothetical protein